MFVNSQSEYKMCSDLKDVARLKEWWVDSSEHFTMASCTHSSPDLGLVRIYKNIFQVF